MHYLTVLNYKNCREIRELLKNQNDSKMWSKSVDLFIYKFVEI